MYYGQYGKELCMGRDLKGKELGDGIYQQKNGTYCARFVDRYGHRKAKRSKKLQEVRKWLAEAINLDQNSSLSCGSNMTVDAWYNYWISMKQQTIRPHTLQNYVNRYRLNIRNEIGSKRLKDVKPLHCQRIFLKMAEEGYTSTTIYMTRATLFNMLEFARDNDILLSNPCKKYLKTNIGKQPVTREALTIEEQKKFLDVLPGFRYENQYRFLLQTGLRTGELTGLKWDDVNLKNRTIKISRTMEYAYKERAWKTGPPKSSSGYRTIPLTAEAVRILKDQKEKNDAIKVIPVEWSSYVFLNKEGMPIKNSTYDVGLAKCCKMAGIRRISMHVLRHVFATRALEGNMKPAVLQRILGHSNIGITMNRYVHITDKEKQKEMALVADILKVV